MGAAEEHAAVPFPFVLPAFALLDTRALPSTRTAPRDASAPHGAAVFLAAADTVKPLDVADARKT